MPLPDEHKQSPATPPSKERQSSLENLEHRLYSRTPPPLRHDEEFIGEERHIRIAPGWTSEAERKESAFYSIFSVVMPWLRRFFVASIIFSLFAGGVALYGFLRGGDTLSRRHISVEVAGPVGAGAGEEMSIEISIRNSNTINLDSVGLLVEFPDGTRNADTLSEPLLRYRETLGPLSAENQLTRRISLVPFGEEGARKQIVVTVEYRPHDSNAIFSEKTDYEFAINSAPVTLTLHVPKEVNSDQAFDMTIELSSNSSAAQENLLVKAQYPFGFKFMESTPAPSFGKDTWRIGDLPPQGKRTIRIRGSIQATEESERTFRFSVGTESLKDEKQIGTTFLDEAPTVSVRRPFLTLDLLVNGEQGKVFIGRSGQVARADIVWGNNLTAKITDLEITASLMGDIYNRASVSAGGGFYDSNTGTVVWNEQKTARFAVVEPGENGTLSFSLSMLPVATNPATFRNPEMTIEVTAKGKRLDELGRYQDVSSTVTKEIKIATALSLSSRLLHADGPFSNFGPVPPVAEQETAYTVVWSLSNAVSGVANAAVTAVLPSYVKWLGETSPDSENVVYNPVGGSIVWNAGEVEAGTGVGTAPREVSFQVSFLPSLGQVGTSPTIIGESTARGTDLFTGIDVSSNTRPALTTASLGDPGAAPESGIVTK